MKKIKMQISDLRKSMPRHIQWLALAAAFIVVLILLTLLIGGKKGDAKIEMTDDVSLQLSVSPDSIDWTDTAIGDKKQTDIKISSNAPVKILAIRQNKDVAGLSYASTCNDMILDSKTACRITLKYEPTMDAKPTGATLYVDWRGAREPDEMKQTAPVVITTGTQSVAPVALPEPEPVRTPIVTEIKQEIETLAPSDPFVEPNDDADDIADIDEYSDDDYADNAADDYVAPAAPAAPVAPVKPNAPAKTSASGAPRTPAPEACSDFAFPGYNLSGTQIGWIRPEHGAYYFHPFSDKKCDSATGIYNPDNGIITDINDSSKKIGTDAEHIGYTVATTGTLPQLSNPPATRATNHARQMTFEELENRPVTGSGAGAVSLKEAPPSDVIYGSSGTGTKKNTAPYDRTFILRQYKPIPATIVSDVRADPKALKDFPLPVRATVDRNVYSDNGRTVIIPTGTLLLGYVTGELPGPYTAIGRMQIKWYQFVLPNGVEFNFGGDGNDPFSADAQGRVGVPGYGSTDYMEQFIMPMLTSIVPAAVNLIAPISDRFVNQIDLDNNTVVQSGQVRSSELAKNEIITAWNQVAQKLMVDMMDNTVPPFSIAAGTRITVYSPVDIQVTCGPGNKKCSAEYATDMRSNVKHNFDEPDYQSESWVGQVHSFNMDQYCTDDGKIISGQETNIYNAGLDYRTVLFYCQSRQYKAINNAKQDAVYQNQIQTSLTDENGGKLINNTKQYNEQVLGLTYNDNGTIQNPFNQPAAAGLTCEDGSNPDSYGCCTGEIYTDMGDDGFNCCPSSGGDCFPPLL